MLNVKIGGETYFILRTHTSSVPHVFDWLRSTAVHTELLIYWNVVDVYNIWQNTLHNNWTVGNPRQFPYNLCYVQKFINMYLTTYIQCPILLHIEASTIMYSNLSKFFKQFLTYTNSRFLETQSVECRGAIGILGNFLSTQNSRWKFYSDKISTYSTQQFSELQI